MTSATELSGSDTVCARAARSAALAIGIDAVRDRQPLRSTRVALIDGPVDRTHSALAHARIAAMGDGMTSSSEAIAHATGVASVLVGSGPELLGLAPEASVLNYSISLSRDPSRTTGSAIEALCAAVDDAVTRHVDVILIPLALRAESISIADLGMLHRTMGRAAQHGVPVIASDANDSIASRRGGDNWEQFAAVLGVYGVSRRGQLMNGCSRVAAGRTCAVLAPGEQIPTAAVGDGASLRSGSSFATAIVAGVFLALAARFPSASAADIRLALTHPLDSVSSSIARATFIDAESSLSILNRLTARGPL
jgi:subtilisin family serine protease